MKFVKRAGRVFYMLCGCLLKGAVETMTAVKVRIEEKEAFCIIGRKIWISGQDNDLFGRFWAESEKSGYIDLVNEYCNGYREL